MLDIFVSRPTWLEPEHRPGLESFLRILRTMDLNPRTLGSTDYPAKSPLDEIIRIMDGCCGAIVLGYPQVRIAAGTIKGSALDGEVLLPTEWNHIEAGLAYARGLPLLVVHHSGIGRGIFDRGAINTFLHEQDFADSAWPTSESIMGALRTWRDGLPSAPPRQSRGTVSEQPRRSPTDKLDDDHRRVLVAFIQPDERPLAFESLHSRLKGNESKLMYYVENLREWDFIGRQTTYGYDPKYCLTKEGRAALVSLGLL